MFNIVIIGFGVAGKIHLATYQNKIQNVAKVLFYDQYLDATGVNTDQFKRVLDIMSELNEPCVLDICTNSDRHLEWIEFANSNCIKHIIVEKPLVTSRDQLMKLRHMNGIEHKNVVVVYNYLYSPVFLAIRKIIENNNFKVLKVKTNFSKNRYLDSNRGRGADREGNLLHNFLIEIPHQISIAIELIGQVSKALDCWTIDMKINDKVCNGHGVGSLQLEHSNGIVSEHYSDLGAISSKRLIEIELSENYRIIGNFGIKPDYVGNVQLWKGNNLIKMQKYNDKSIDIFIREAMKYFEGENDNPCEMTKGLIFNEVILECISKTIINRP